MDLLVAHEFTLPDGVHETVGSVSVDFVFRSDNSATAVFVDDGAPGSGRDHTVEDDLMDLGWSVVRFGPGDDWLDVLRSHSYVFGEGRK